MVRLFSHNPNNMDHRPTILLVHGHIGKCLNDALQGTHVREKWCSYSLAILIIQMAGPPDGVIDAIISLVFGLFRVRETVRETAAEKDKSV